jgi:hypothetical protein
MAVAMIGVGYTGSTIGISLYMMGLALITLLATFFAHETVGKWNARS